MSDERDLLFEQRPSLSLSPSPNFASRSFVGLSASFIDSSTASDSRKISQRTPSCAELFAEQTSSKMRGGLKSAQVLLKTVASPRHLGCSRPKLISADDGLSNLHPPPHAPGSMQPFGQRLKCIVCSSLKRDSSPWRTRTDALFDCLSNEILADRPYFPIL